MLSRENMQEALITADEARKVFGLLNERAERSPDTVALSEYDETRRDWVDYSWNDILGRAKRIAAAFKGGDGADGAGLTE